MAGPDLPRIAGQDAVRARAAMGGSLRRWSCVNIGRVPGAEFEIVTDRLSLRVWRASDADDFAEMNADVEVMADLGGPSRAKRVTESWNASSIRSTTTESPAGSSRTATRGSWAIAGS